MTYTCLLGVEVGDANRSDEAEAHRRLHAAPRLGKVQIKVEHGSRAVAPPREVVGVRFGRLEGVRPVDEVQVEVVELELRERVPERADHLQHARCGAPSAVRAAQRRWDVGPYLILAVLGAPQLRSDEELFARANARSQRCGNACTHLVLIVVAVCRVDMPVAAAKRTAHGLLDDARRLLPSAEPDQRHVRAAVQRDAV